MSGITDRIGKLLHRHMLVRYDRNAWWCKCGDGDDCLSVEGSHAAHVAEVLVAELGLREIRTTGALVGDMLHMTYDGSASPHRCYQTPWEPAS